jgi:hypothetical protein
MGDDAIGPADRPLPTHAYAFSRVTVVIRLGLRPSREQVAAAIAPNLQ